MTTATVRRVFFQPSGLVNFTKACRQLHSEHDSNLMIVASHVADLALRYYQHEAAKLGLHQLSGFRKGVNWYFSAHGINVRVATDTLIHPDALMAIGRMADFYRKHAEEV